jgi:hypothetical protein
MQGAGLELCKASSQLLLLFWVVSQGCLQAAKRECSRSKVGPGKAHDMANVARAHAHALFANSAVLIWRCTRGGQ